MEYLLGFISCLSIVMAMYFAMEKYEKINKIDIKPIRYRQSHIHSIISPFIYSDDSGKPVKKTQSRNHDAKVNIKVIIMDNKAYWIKDNIFYTADMLLDGTVNKETTRRVDTMGMSNVQLDKMMFIIDKLREGTFDDSGGSGN